VEALNAARALPQGLRHHESWETWLELRELPTRKVDGLARVQLSSGKTVKSKARDGVGPAGIIPGAQRS